MILGVDIGVIEFCEYYLSVEVTATVQYVPYFFAYKTVFSSIQNNPKNLDPSHKTDLDLWDCLGRVKSILQQNCIRLILIMCTHSREGKPRLIAE